MDGKVANNGSTSTETGIHLACGPKRVILPGLKRGPLVQYCYSLQVTMLSVLWRECATLATTVGDKCVDVVSLVPKKRNCLHAQNTQ